MHYSEDKRNKKISFEKEGLTLVFYDLIKELTNAAPDMDPELIPNYLFTQVQKVDLKACERDMRGVNKGLIKEERILIEVNKGILEDKRKANE